MLAHTPIAAGPGETRRARERRVAERRGDEWRREEKKNEGDIGGGNGGQSVSWLLMQKQEVPFKICHITSGRDAGLTSSVANHINHLIC